MPPPDEDELQPLGGGPIGDAPIGPAPDPDFEESGPISTGVGLNGGMQALSGGLQQ